MKIIVVGAGWTGLVASYRLLQRGYEVTLVEQGSAPGGLAASFRAPRWRWPLEKFYHHWFTNDETALRLARELKQRVHILAPKTAVWHDGVIYPFDTPRAILSAAFLPISARIRLGAVIAWLKLHPNIESLHRIRALAWLKKYMGKTAVAAVWEPLLSGKFGRFAPLISLTWFAARIKKRTPRLAYPVGGFVAMQEKLIARISALGGIMHLNFGVKQITRTRQGQWRVVDTRGRQLTADALLLTTPSGVTARLLPELSTKIRRKLTRIRHLFAQVLVIASRQPLLPETYWLNISDPKAPFLAVVAHTNMVSARAYGGTHLTYIGNYLPNDHPYLHLSARELLSRFAPYLDRIVPGWEKTVTRTYLWQLPHAQPIVDTQYRTHLPPYRLSPAGLYLANMDMVYPWDRGTNYAMDEGEKIAQLIDADLAKRM
jgi:protoporphyrinogen oxidase